MAVSFVQATGAGTSTAILLPASRAAGDLLILSMATENTQPSSPPDGWFVIGSQGRGTAGDNTNACRIILYGRISDASDTSFDTINTAGMVTGPYVHATTAWRGVSPIDPVADTIGFGSGASAGSHATNRSAAIAYDGSMLVLASALAEPTNQTFTSSTGLSLSERVDVISNQGLGVVSAPIDAQASVTETITSTHASTPFVSVFICLNPDVPLTVDVTVDGTVPAFTGDADITFQGVTVDGQFASFTGDAELELISSIEIDGTVSAFAGDAVVSVGVTNIEIDAAIPAFNGSAEILPGQLVGIEGEFGGFYIDPDDFYIAMPISIFGTFAGFTGNAEIELTSLIEVDGEFGAFTGDASVTKDETNDIDIAGAFAAFTFDGFINSGAILTVPGDTDYIITVPAVDRTATVVSLDRTITIPGLIRTLEVP